jgi:2-oxoglutarate dehydrogenase E1 component
MEEMWRQWKQDPATVHKSWDVYFRNVEAGLAPGLAFQAPPTIQGPTNVPILATQGGRASVAGPVDGADPRVLHLVRAFQVRGHEIASLDPLGLRPTPSIPELDPSTYGFTEADLDKSIELAGFLGVKGFLSNSGDRCTLRELIERLRKVYCGSIGFEYMHMLEREKCNWIRERIERDSEPLSNEKRLQLYDRLIYAEELENVFADVFNTKKRFGLEGAESLVPGLKFLVDRATLNGVTDIVIGMPHRGRLNTLVNVMRKPTEMIFKEFRESHVNASDLECGDGDRFTKWTASGDVKYHLGTSYSRTYPDGRTINLSLVANPSHLEAVNPVVAGKVRAKQDKKLATEGMDPRTTLGLMMHGDAAFAGQGIVYETMMLSQLKGYGNSGTVHVVVNNQVGFTTDPKDSRSTLYCSDIGKAFDIPIFHVNADDAEAVTRVFEMAVDYRQTFGVDVIVDLIGYRRMGHNELDNPFFTQPTMYDKISKHPTSSRIYRDKLVAEGVASGEALDKMRADTVATLKACDEKSHTFEHSVAWLSSNWKGFFTPREHSKVLETGVEMSELETVAKALVTLPENFRLHSALKRIMGAKQAALEAKEGIDWGTAEALAFGTLAREGTLIRLSGQDSQRGTFSHRHSVLHDQVTNEEFMPLKHLGEGAADVQVFNSPLSEYGVMGFELGYSLESPYQLVMWEGQFGDFVNGAQIIIDQFLSAGENKWYRQCGLTLLLPHGYDGQGPEHSSCRIERFLQMSDEPEDVVPDMEEVNRRQIQATNWQILNATTPANYFHALRRQVHRRFRKPLVVATPKYLLRHKQAVSSFSEMGVGTKFKRTYPDDGTIVTDPEKVKRVVFCTGKVYYDLIDKRKELGADDVAISRIEQLSPFPFDRVAKEIARYPASAEIVWAQEEPRNMGGWHHVAPRIETATKHFLPQTRRPSYAGRPTAASPASGFDVVHKVEQGRLVLEALGRA